MSPHHFLATVNFAEEKLSTGCLILFKIGNTTKQSCIELNRSCGKLDGIYKNSYHVDLDLECKSRICCWWMAVDGVFRISEHFIRP